MRKLHVFMTALVVLGLVGCLNPTQPPESTTGTSQLAPALSTSTSAVVTTEFILCLDVSGSINQSELTLEINGLKACLNDASIVPTDGSASVGIVVYGVTASSPLALTPITATSLTNTIEPVLTGLLSNRIVGTGATNIGAGLINSRALLSGGTTNNQFILLVGDGAANTGPNVNTECQNTANAGITICAIAVGASSAGQAQLQSCALATGGSYGNAPTFNDFLPVCQDCLFVILVGQLELTPDYDLNPTGTNHTVTATARSGNTPFPPLVGVTVDFLVVSGPNAGDNGSDVTDANGEATFTYLGDGGVGIDVIEASMTDPATSNLVTSNSVQKEWFNSPPVCDANGPYSEECLGATTDVALDGTGSSDPDNDPLTYLWTTNCPSGSFDDATSVTPILTVDTSGGPVNCTVFLTVDDGLASASCSTSVSIVDTTPPVIVLKAGSIELWPPNHKYRTIDVADCIESVTDVCDGSIGLGSVEVAGVSSDEVENANGVGDGNTLNDIVIACPNEVNVRCERQGTSDGRVYSITYTVTDASGNSASVTCTVGVPHDQSGPAAVDGPGPGYSVSGCLPPPAAAALMASGNNERQIRQ